MPIIPNNVVQWTGAATRLVPPIDAGDCEIFPDFNELCLQESAVDRGCTIRAGQGYAARTVAQIEGSCTPLTPNPTSTDPAFPTKNAPCDIIGVNFYGVAGQVHIGDAATWAGCIVTTQQPITTWAGALIAVTSMTWGGPAPGAWLYVLNQYGRRNENGLNFFWAP